MEEGVKYDEQKLRWDLLPFDSVEDIVKVYTFGAEKYGDENWRAGIKWKRIIAAIFRHLTAFVLGEDIDKESGLPHLSHAGWGILTLLWYSRYRIRFDDRYISTNEKKVEKKLLD